MQTGEEDLKPDSDPSTASRIHTVEEVRAGLDALRDDEKAKLRKISWALAPKAGMDGDELYQEAVARMLTTRSCSADVSILAYAAGVMRSVASDAYSARKAAAAKDASAIRSAANDGAEPLSEDLAPDEELIDRDRQQHYRDCLSRIEALIADDQPLQLLLLGLSDGMRGQELENLMGTDTKGLAAAYKRLARVRCKAFPKGSPLERGK